MSEAGSAGLKPGWRRVRLGDVVENVNDFHVHRSGEALKYVAGEHIDEGDLRVKRSGLTSDDLVPPTFNRLFKAGDVLFHSRNIRKLAQPEFDGLTGEKLFVLRTRNQNLLSQDLLPFLLQTERFQNYVEERWAGSTNKFLNKTPLMAYEFALPHATEQARIVETLQASRAVADAQADALTRLQSLRQSTIDHLLRLPKSGTIVRLEQVATMQNGRPFPGDEYADKGTRLLRPGNLGASGYLTWLTDKTVCLDPKWEASAADFVIHPGDVVINLTAQSLEDGFMGRVCLAREHDKSLLNQRIGRFRCNEDVLRPEFLFRCLQTSRFRQHAHANCEGSKVKHMFWQHLAKYEIAIPNISVQEEVIAQCASIDEAIGSLGSRLAASQQLAARLTNQLAGGT